MSIRILTVNGDPDPKPEQFCAALCSAYASGVQSAGGETRRLDIASLHPSSAGSVFGEPPSADLRRAAEDIHWAHHLAIVFPLCFDEPPKLLDRFFPSLGPNVARASRIPTHALHEDKLARIVVTMSMPALIYRRLFRENDMRAPASSTLSQPAVKPVNRTFIGSVDLLSPSRRMDWLQEMHVLGVQDIRTRLFAKFGRTPARGAFPAKRAA